MPPSIKTGKVHLPMIPQTRIEPSELNRFLPRPAAEPSRLPAFLPPLPPAMNFGMPDLKSMAAVKFAEPKPLFTPKQKDARDRLDAISTPLLRARQEDARIYGADDPAYLRTVALCDRADDLFIKVMQSSDFVPDEGEITAIENEFFEIMKGRIEDRLLPSYETLSALAGESGNEGLAERVADWKVRYDALSAMRRPLDSLAEDYKKIFREVFVGEFERAGAELEVLDKHYLEMFAVKLFDMNLLRSGLSKETLREFAAEWVSFRRDYASDLNGNFDLIALDMTSHHLVGRGKSADGFLRTLTLNLRGYRAAFGENAGRVFSRSLRPAAEMKDPSGKGTGFYVVLERGWHEAHFGLQLAIYEGDPSGMGVSAVLGKVGFHFAEPGVVRVVNIQGMPITGVLADLSSIANHFNAYPLDPAASEVRVRATLAKSSGNRVILNGVIGGAIALMKQAGTPVSVDAYGRFAPALRDAALQDQRKRLNRALGKGHPFSALLAGVMHWAHGAGFERVEGVRDAAQTAQSDRQRKDGRPESAVYDATFARMGFFPPAEGEDQWTFDLRAPSVHHPEVEILASDLGEYFAVVLPRNVANNQIQYESWEKGSPKPNASEVKAFNVGIAAGLDSLRPTASARRQ